MVQQFYSGFKLLTLVLIKVCLAERKFLVPLFWGKAGIGNQIIELQSAAVIAKLLNRTLCLTPFDNGPPRHRGHFGRDNTALNGRPILDVVGLEDNFDLSFMKRFVEIEELDTCKAACENVIDSLWILRPGLVWHGLGWNLKNAEKLELNLAHMYVWRKPDDVIRALGDRRERCPMVGGLFPGLRWRGAFLSSAPFLVSAPELIKSAHNLRKAAFGLDNVAYIAVHWRFDESRCREEDKGLCFIRCFNGAEPDEPSVIVSDDDWKEAMKKGKCRKRGRSFGVRLAVEDIATAIADKARNESIKFVYLATDAWLRSGCDILGMVVKELRAQNISVVGTWNCEFSSFSDGTMQTERSLVKILGLNNSVLANSLISRLEQTIALEANVFMGSGQSSWSLVVARTRMANRMALKLLSNITLPEDYNVSDWPMRKQKKVDESIIQTLIEDDYEAANYCLYHLNKFISNRANVSHGWHEEDGKDIWLDFAGCEGLLHKGGHCRFPYC